MRNLKHYSLKLSSISAHISSLGNSMYGPKYQHFIQLEIIIPSFRNVCAKNKVAVANIFQIDYKNYSNCQTVNTLTNLITGA